jgi:hypothetical protein
MNLRLGPWIAVCLIGFVMYAAAGWFHGGGARSVAFYGVAIALLAGALFGIARRAKPPLR